MHPVHTSPQAVAQAGEEAAAKVVAEHAVIAFKRLAGEDKQGDGVDVDDGNHERGDHDQRLAVLGHGLNRT